MNSLELLAPAGELAAIEPYIKAGANAIYVGFAGLSSRPSASDFTRQDIIKAVSLCHANGVTLHVALNGCISHEDLERTYEAIQWLDGIGVDALILADWGILNHASRIVRHAALHASTLLGVYNTATINELIKMGVSRIVFCTNLYMNEMAAIHDTFPDLEYEIVADGGICFNDNRMCELPHLNDRDSYRVFCREEYEKLEDGKCMPANPICAKAISSNEILRLYVELGISSFKIEGRTLSYLHVLPRVKALRKAIDESAGHPSARISSMHYIDRMRPKLEN